VLTRISIQQTHCAHPLTVTEFLPVIILVRMDNNRNIPIRAGLFVTFRQRTDRKHYPAGSSLVLDPIIHLWLRTKYCDGKIVVRDTRFNFIFSTLFGYTSEGVQWGFSEGCEGVQWGLPLRTPWQPPGNPQATPWQV